MDKLDGVTALALVLIASFAVDRIVTGGLFLLSFNRKWSQALPDPASIEDQAVRRQVEKRHKLIYFAFAGVVGVVILGWLGKVRILSAILHATNPDLQINPILDAVITGLLLMGGADSLAQILKLPGSPAAVEKAQSTPIQVVGKLTIEDKEQRP